MLLEHGSLRSCLVPLAGQPLRGLGQLVNPRHQVRVAELVELMAKAALQCRLELVAFLTQCAGLGPRQFKVGLQAGGARREAGVRPVRLKELEEGLKHPEGLETLGKVLRVYRVRLGVALPTGR
ncbi:hypothetical protein [Streptomyces sp. NPDC002671]